MIIDGAFVPKLARKARLKLETSYEVATKKPVCMVEGGTECGEQRDTGVRAGGKRSRSCGAGAARKALSRIDKQSALRPSVQPLCDAADERHQCRRVGFGKRQFTGFRQAIRGRGLPNPSAAAPRRAQEQTIALERDQMQADRVVGHPEGVGERIHGILTAAHRFQHGDPGR